MILQRYLHCLLAVFLCLGGVSAWTLAPQSRRDLLQQSILTTTASILLGTSAVHAADNPIGTIKVTIDGPNDSVGVQVYNTELRGRKVVAIQRVIQPKSPKLQEGMILKDFPTAQAFSQRLTSGPFPLEIEFIDLAAGGDAISDLGTPLVTSKDALELAQKTDQSSENQKQRGGGYSITTLQRPQSKCAMQSRRGDVLEINYEAAYESIDGLTVSYDASSFRGTGQPYQMVMGSGDMIPGVDQGLYDMCPGEVRRLKIPPPLAYGPRARDAFRIPPDYVGLEWRVELVSIDGTIRQDNNDQTREDREGRFSY
jgi:hypothetical protein